jgi:hypothetical protein
MPRARAHDLLLARPVLGTLQRRQFAVVGRAGCLVTRGHFANIYVSGLWELDLVIDDSHGTLLRRSIRVII